MHPADRRLRAASGASRGAIVGLCIGELAAGAFGERPEPHMMCGNVFLGDMLFVFALMGLPATLLGGATMRWHNTGWTAVAAVAGASTGLTMLRSFDDPIPWVGWTLAVTVTLAILGLVLARTGHIEGTREPDRRRGGRAGAVFGTLTAAAVLSLGGAWVMVMNPLHLASILAAGAVVGGSIGHRLTDDARALVSAPPTAPTGPP